MRIDRICWVLIALAFSALAWGAPYMGYVYPAGGQQGTVLHVIVGGQRLGNVKNIVFTGSGVNATFVEFEGEGGPLNGEQRDLLRKRIQELIAKLMPAPPPPKVTPTTPAAPPATTPAPPATPAAPPATI